MQSSNLVAESTLVQVIMPANTRNFQQVVALLINAMECFGVDNENLTTATAADKALFERFWMKLFDKEQVTPKMSEWAGMVIAIVHAAELGRSFGRLAAKKCDDISAAANYVLTHASIEPKESEPRERKAKPRFTIYQGGANPR
jgi:hypothetical protein